MANTRTITAADVILYLSVETIFPVAQRIQGFSADDITGAESIENLESSMGVDGRLSAGYVPQAITQMFTLQADSLSNDFFEAWNAYQVQTRGTYVATGNLIMPAIGRKYAMTRGFLRGYKPFADAKKTLAPRAFSIIWERVTPAPV